MIDNDPQVRMQVDLSPVAASETPSSCLHAITFTLISGNIRRFRRICEHIQSMVSLHTKADRNIYSLFTFKLKTYPVSLRNILYTPPDRLHFEILWNFDFPGLCFPSLRPSSLSASPTTSSERFRVELNIFAVLLLPLLLLLLLIIIIIITSKDPRWVKALHAAPTPASDSSTDLDRARVRSVNQFFSLDPFQSITFFSLDPFSKTPFVGNLI